jgi:predicted nucleotide-binding protein (sugar kinase/HSP70/actin superfamily)
MEETFGVSKDLTLKAIAQGDNALASFRADLCAEGTKIIADVTKAGTFAVVLGARHYQNDELVNHNLSRFFTNLGHPVLTLDSLPDIGKVDLSKTRLEITNNSHARILAGAILAAQNPHLEYVQVVSFGCGHDALLADETTRVLQEISGKSPLVLKLDESDVHGPLHLRIKSFIETVQTRRKKLAGSTAQTPKDLSDPFPVKYTRADRKLKTVLVPNVSVAFCKVISAAIRRQGYRVEPLPLGGNEAIKLGKKYVHNDICFPAQMCIGEALSVLQSGKYDPKNVAIGMAKFNCDCRLTNYNVLVRKALDEAGYADVPVITTAGTDSKNQHPGFQFNASIAVRTVTGLVMTDILEDLVRKIRPYEVHPGETNRVYDVALDEIGDALYQHGIKGAAAVYERTVDALCAVAYDRSVLKPPVLVTGEYLLNYHPGSNFHVEEYLEKHNMEVIFPRMADVFRKYLMYTLSDVKDFHVAHPFWEVLAAKAGDKMFDRALDRYEKIARRHPLYEPSLRLPDLAGMSDPVLHRSFNSGETYLIPAEIMHHAERGVHNFVILQPFGCLPNHICGRGVMKRIKELYPNIQILTLDYDPDTSFANIENRLQMLIMNARNFG